MQAWHSLRRLDTPDVLVCLQLSPDAGKEQVLRQLARIIDPDFGHDIVSCGFVKELKVVHHSGQVTFALELTMPACPVRDKFERKVCEYMEELSWVQQVKRLPLSCNFLQVSDTSKSTKKLHRVGCICVDRCLLMLKCKAWDYVAEPSYAQQVCMVAICMDMYLSSLALKMSQRGLTASRAGQVQSC